MTAISVSSGSSRLHGLDTPAIRQVIATATALDLGRVDEAEQHIAALLATSPTHPEVLRLLAGIQSLRGRHQDAIETMHRALVSRPADALYFNTLGTVLNAGNDLDGAIVAFRRSCELQPDLVSAWYNLGLMLIRSIQFDAAIEAFRHAVALNPEHIYARVQLADVLKADGRFEGAIDEYRRITDRHPGAGMAWWGLADIKTIALGDDDIERMQQALQLSSINEDDRIGLGFALAKALEDKGRYAESLAQLAQTNQRARERKKWDAAAFSQRLDGILRQITAAPAATVSELGNPVIFIAGLPRSGSTLVEQILASHADVEGANELPDIPLVLNEESTRAGRPFPQWVEAMQAADWQRLGQRYLERTARWRKPPRDISPTSCRATGTTSAQSGRCCPLHTSSSCRRDPLETCLSCYRQLSRQQRVHAHVSPIWPPTGATSIAPHVTGTTCTTGPRHENRYEDLVADRSDDPRIACVLRSAFEPACLELPQDRARRVYTPSAAQVREPLRATRRGPRVTAPCSILCVPPSACAPVSHRRPKTEIRSAHHGKYRLARLVSEIRQHLAARISCQPDCQPARRRCRWPNCRATATRKPTRNCTRDVAGETEYANGFCATVRTAPAVHARDRSGTPRRRCSSRPTAWPACTTACRCTTPQVTRRRDLRRAQSARCRDQHVAPLRHRHRRSDRLSRQRGYGDREHRAVRHRVPRLLVAACEAAGRTWKARVSSCCATRTCSTSRPRGSARSHAWSAWTPIAAASSARSAMRAFPRSRHGAARRFRRSADQGQAFLSRRPRQPVARRADTRAGRAHRRARIASRWRVSATFPQITE